MNGGGSTNNPIRARNPNCKSEPFLNMTKAVVATFLSALSLILAPSLSAHESRNERPSVLVATDMGLDDLVAVGLALQSPEITVRGIVAGEGACGRESSADNAGRLLDRFNRADVPLFVVPDASGQGAPPPFRPFAEQAVSKVLGAGAGISAKIWKPEKNSSANSGKLAVLVLGPFSDLEAMLEKDPRFASRISKIVAPGPPDPEKNWNLARDRAAFGAVSKRNIPVVFVDSGNHRARKPAGWSEPKPDLGRITSPAAQLIADLLASGEPGRHYLKRFPGFTDELAFLFLAEPSLFRVAGDGPVLTAEPTQDATPRLLEHLREGRQRRERVVFSEAAWPPEMFRTDVRERMERIIRKNGGTEWFSQVLMNEMHEHLGAYSILGAKMGLRAAELLNAPQHGVRVVSHTPRRPPAGCLNDGIIVATGSTPGRGLFSFGAPMPGVQATFESNGRRLRLVLRRGFQQRIRDFIAATLREHSLEDPEYWREIRAFGLEIWENWHRNDLFDVRWIGNSEKPGVIDGN